MLSDGGLPLLRDKFVPVKINNHETTLNEVIMTFLFPRGLIKESRELVPLRSVVFFFPLRLDHYLRWRSNLQRIGRFTVRVCY